MSCEGSCRQHRSDILAENQNTSDRTKHVVIRFHFIRQHIQEGTVKVEFVRSQENDADLFTKNVNGETFEELRRKMVEKSMNGQHKKVQQEGC